MSRALVIVAVGIAAGALSAAGAPSSAGSAGGSASSSASGSSGGSTGGATYGGVLPQGTAMTWTVKVVDNATSAPLAKVSVTALELTWDCKTREVPLPRGPDNHHRPHSRTEIYDCKGGTKHITKLTDASGTATLQLPHSLYQLGPIKHPSYLATDLPDPMYQRIAASLVKTSISNGGASRLTEYRLFPTSALKVKTSAQAESLALANPVVKKCLAAHPQLTHAIQKPSLMWRVQFLYAGANNMVFESTVDTISADVGFLGCWDPCCAVRAPSRFEKRLLECPKLRSATKLSRKSWDCDTLPQDFVKLQDFLRKKGDDAELKRYEALYRAYEDGEKKAAGATNGGAGK
jgi:hypothetical protein